jgi:hypothetical protein
MGIYGKLAVAFCFPLPLGSLISPKVRVITGRGWSLPDIGTVLPGSPVDEVKAFEGLGDVPVEGVPLQV